MAAKPVQARINGVTYALERDGDTTLLNGEPIDLRVEHLDDMTYLVVINNEPTVVTLEPQKDGNMYGSVGGYRTHVELKTAADLLLEKYGMDTGSSSAEREIRAPMPGLVLRILVEPGDAVEAGQGVAVLEAMKMENELKAPRAGTVSAVHTEPGAAVGKNDLLIELAAEG